MRILTSARLALVLTVALAALGAYALSAAAQETDSVSIAVDADSEGNSPNALGETDVCSELAVGEERTIDIVIRGIPEVSEGSGGIEGLQFDLNYDEEYVNITALDVSGQLMGLNPGSNLIDLSDDVPNDNGLMTVASADFGSGAAESGDGVLARLTLRGVGAGTSDLRLTALQVNGLANFEYDIDTVQNGLLAVGVSCAEGATPPPPPVTPQPPRTPVTSGDESPAPGETDGPGGGDGESPDGTPGASDTPANGGVGGGPDGDGDGGGDDDGGSGWIIVVVIVIAIVAVAGGVYALRRRGSTS